MCFTMAETLEREPVNCLHVRVRAESGTTSAVAERTLREGNPSVRVHVIGDALVVVMDTIADEHEDLLGDRLEAALRAPV